MDTYIYMSIYTTEIFTLIRVVIIFISETYPEFYLYYYYKNTRVYVQLYVYSQLYKL